MLLQSNTFNIKEFRIPEFTLGKGEMIRFWVEIVPIPKDGTNGYWGVSRMKEVIKGIDDSIYLAPVKLKTSVFDFLKPITVRKYLEQKFGYSDDEIEKLISRFGIKPYYQLQKLGCGHGKLFSILCEFQKRDIVVFDYYGLSLESEKQLTDFVKSEIQKGKSAISFDNLYYKPASTDSEKIINLDILRERN
ncbi:hypothetical protein [Winogradskyella sp. 3972H.M.0a.05]|uniref:hypothetical protein n=1 Tax=Winogradskyella sp. 3972H.M.0a.05 TaxID=2950277 RepID=UPI0033993631